MSVRIVVHRDDGSKLEFASLDELSDCLLAALDRIAEFEKQFEVWKKEHESLEKECDFWQREAGC